MPKSQMNNDPLGLLRLDLVYIEDPYIEKPLLVQVQAPYGKAQSLLPFDKDKPAHRRITILKALNSERFNGNSFKEDELKWMKQENLLSNNGKAFHPEMRKKIGMALYRTLFPTGSDTETRLKAVIYERLTDQVAQGRLHIQIGIESKNVGSRVRLLDYPWELLHDGEDFLVRRGIEISRYINYGNPVPQIQLRDQINVLLVSSKACDPIHELGLLKDDEYQAVLEELQHFETTFGHICVQPLINPTREIFRKYLQDHSGASTPHIIHFDGHGHFGSYCLNTKDDGNICKTFNPGEGVKICSDCEADLPPPQGYLLLRDEEKGDETAPEYVSAEDIGSFIEQANQSNEADQKIMLVVLSACKSSMALAQDSVFNGIAQNLIHHQIAAVVGMAFTIRAASAKRFATNFYDALGKRFPLTEAMHWGRQAMNFSLNQWFRPTLYLRGLNHNDGRLFGPLTRELNIRIEHLQQLNTPEERLGTYQRKLQSSAEHLLTINARNVNEEILDTIKTELHLIISEVGKMNRDVADKYLRSRQKFQKSLIIAVRQLDLASDPDLFGEDGRPSPKEFSKRKEKFYSYLTKCPTYIYQSLEEFLPQ